MFLSCNLSKDLSWLMEPGDKKLEYGAPELGIFGADDTELAATDIACRSTLRKALPVSSSAFESRAGETLMDLSESGLSLTLSPMPLSLADLSSGWSGSALGLTGEWCPGLLGPGGDGVPAEELREVVGDKVRPPWPGYARGQVAGVTPRGGIPRDGRMELVSMCMALRNVSHLNLR